MPSRLLPTHPDQGDGDVIDFLRAFRSECRSNLDASELLIVTYAASLAGWNLVKDSITRFRRQKSGRRVQAIIGLDHLLTQPPALLAMRRARIEVRTVSTWPNVFHPKLFVFRGGTQLTILTGSNNLTRGGLRSNYEFAVRVRLAADHSRRFDDWLEAVLAVSDGLTTANLADYREQFERSRAVRRLVPTTRQRVRQMAAPGEPVERRFRRAIVEVTPRETGTEGTQIQMPMEVVRGFFGMGANDSREFTVRNDDTGGSRGLTLTTFGNNTARLSLREVTLAVRPCVLELWWTRATLVVRVVRQAENAGEYQRLLEMCVSQTRRGSKRFCLLR